jgi:hypothetical protein
MSSAPGGVVIVIIFNLIYGVLFGHIGCFLGKAIVWMVTLGRYPTLNPSTGSQIGNVELEAVLKAMIEQEVQR